MRYKKDICLKSLNTDLVNSRTSKFSKYPKRKRFVSGSPKKRRVDAATLASRIQLAEEKIDLTYSSIFLSIKWGLLFICFASLFKLGIAGHQRFERYQEVSTVLKQESKKLVSSQSRFDDIFTIGGVRRLLDEQQQFISPNRVRVVWR
tara:strand:+ start:2190 stop:2633 length:444 start_codon:yes stop_codon:yes gene_type:complete